MRVAEASVERTLGILTRLVNLASSQGHDARPTDAALNLVIESQAIEFAVEEKTMLVPHTPTAMELKRQRRQDSWGNPHGRIPTHDHVPSGNLSIIIRSNSYSGLRRTYSDRKGRKLEDMAHELFATFVEHAVYAQEQARRIEQQRREWKEAEERRQRAEAFDDREKRCMQFVDAIHEQLLLHAKLSSVLAHLDAAEDAKPIKDQREWVRLRLRDVEALISPRFLELSARSAKVGFSEKDQEASEGHSHYGASKIELHYWQLDDKEEYWTAVGPLAWRGMRSEGS